MLSEAPHTKQALSNSWNFVLVVVVAASISPPALSLQ
jgi:hypothetical protein